MDFKGGEIEIYLLFATFMQSIKSALSIHMGC